MKQRIRQSDKLRSIFTEFIPYEVPLRFTFMHIYEVLKDSSRPKWIEELIKKSRDLHTCIPYSYSIVQKPGKRRRLGVMNPLLLQKAAEVLGDADDLLISLCNKSQWSLRRPVRVAKIYFSPHDRESDRNAISEPGADEDEARQEVGVAVEEGSTFQDFASSYFVYEPINLLQKFFESRELLQLERRFCKCRRLDIAKCFDNIYSHSISWAVKGKEAAKIEKRCRFTLDGRLDAIMQQANHGETHGILIGAEFSRIFAEVILQEVDARTRHYLESNVAPLNGSQRTPGGLIDERDYTVRRYIDDYFVFFNDESVADSVQLAIERQLEKYKIYLNDNKTTDETRPFTTLISVARREIHMLLADQLDCSEEQLVKGRTETGALYGPRFQSDRILGGLRLIVSKLGVSIHEISVSVLRHLSTLLAKKCALLRSLGGSAERAAEWFRCVIEVAFYIYSVDIRFRTSLMIGRMIEDVTQASGTLAVEVAEAVEDVFLRETVAVVKQVVKMRDPCQLEMATLLICLRGVCKEAMIPAQLIREMSGVLGSGPTRGDYFWTIALIYFCNDCVEYQSIQQRECQDAVSRIRECKQLLESAELISLSLDLLSCPWVDGPCKRAVALRLLSALSKPNPSEAEILAFIKQFSSRTWLFDWRSGVSNQAYYKKKELSIAY